MQLKMCFATGKRVCTPLSVDKEKAIDYGNMLGVCDGGEKITGQQGHILCCDAHKKETEISTSPWNKLQMDKIAYKPDGTIFTEPKDVAIEKDINETLLLNGVRKPDGSVRDTSTEILKGRRDAYDRARRMMENLNRSGKCTSAVVKKIVDNLLNQEEREEYAGVKLYLFRKKVRCVGETGIVINKRKGLLGEGKDDYSPHLSCFTNILRIE